jgi:hypothetical protein
MKDQILKQYKHMKNAMESCVPAKNAKIDYHFLADAIYWADEVPDGLDSFSENCLRIVLRYRTTMIIGNQEEKWKPYWDAAKSEFPNWIGFNAARCCKSQKNASLYSSFRSKAMDSVNI